MKDTNLDNEIRDVVRKYGIKKLSDAFYTMLDEAIAEVTGRKDFDDYECLDTELTWGEKNWGILALKAVTGRRVWNNQDTEVSMSIQQLNDVMELSEKIRLLAVGSVNES